MGEIFINLKENFYNVLDGFSVDRIPVVPVTTITLMEYRNKIGITFPEAHMDTDKMIKLATSPYEISHIEGINIPFDMTMESEAIGCEIDLRKDDQTPEVIKTPFITPSDVEIPDDFPNSHRFDVLFEAIDKINNDYEDVPLIIGVVGPFTLLGQLLGIESLLKYLKTDYFEVEDALSRVSEGLMSFIEKLDMHDVVICICEPSCSSDLLDPNIFKTLVKPELEYLSDQSGSRIILHVCGNSQPIIEDMLTCGYNAISIEDIVDLNYVIGLKNSLDTDTQICGNISTNTALLLGSPAVVENEVKVAINEGIDVLCSSCSVPPHSPESNVRMMVSARNKYCSNN